MVDGIFDCGEYVKCSVCILTTEGSSGGDSRRLSQAFHDDEASVQSMYVSHAELLSREERQERMVDRQEGMEKQLEVMEERIESLMERLSKKEVARKNAEVEAEKLRRWFDGW